MRRIVLGIIVLFAVASPALAQVDGEALPGRYIALYRGDGLAVQRAAERLGASVLVNHAGAGILIVEAAPSDFPSRFGAVVGVSHVLADRWIVPSEPDHTLGSVTLSGASRGEATSVSSPFDAFFLPYQWNIFQTQTDNAWSITQGSSSVKVAIVDSGICMHHDDLAGKIDLALSKSFVPSSQEAPNTAAPACIGCPAWEDRYGHGTWVASIVSTNDLGIAGVAPNVRLVAVKVANYQDIGPLSALANGIVYAADVGSDVINVSRVWGQHPVLEFPHVFALLERMFTYATRQGALLVFAAGNDGVDLDRAGRAIAVPCDITNSMCVGATTASDALAAYSNHGVSAVTMVAPGGGLPVDPLPDILENETVFVACSVHGMTWDCIPQQYFLVTGTSVAAPMVSGAAALILSAKPHFKGKPQQVKSTLFIAADDLGQTGTDNLFSRGRLNTLRAVQ